MSSPIEQYRSNIAFLREQGWSRLEAEKIIEQRYPGLKERCREVVQMRSVVYAERRRKDAVAQRVAMAQSVKHRP